MDITDIIIIGLFTFLILFAIIIFVWMLIITPINEHFLYKETNKIQWMCKESTESVVDRLSNKTNDMYCDLFYRVLPSELPKFVRIFSDNPWYDVYEFQKLKINTKEEFEDFVKDFKTLKDIHDFHNHKNGVLWYHP